MSMHPDDMVVLTAPQDSNMTSNVCNSSPSLSLVPTVKPLSNKLNYEC